MDNAELLALVHQYGLAILAPLALIEGPIVSILGGYLAGHGLVSLPALLVVVIAADPWATRSSTVSGGAAGDCCRSGCGRG